MNDDYACSSAFHPILLAGAPKKGYFLTFFSSFSRESFVKKTPPVLTNNIVLTGNHTIHYFDFAWIAYYVVTIFEVRRERARGASHARCDGSSVSRSGRASIPTRPRASFVCLNSGKLYRAHSRLYRSRFWGDAFAEQFK